MSIKESGVVLARHERPVDLLQRVRKLNYVGSFADNAAIGLSLFGDGQDDDEVKEMIREGQPFFEILERDLNLCLGLGSPTEISARPSYYKVIPKLFPSL